MANKPGYFTQLSQQDADRRGLSMDEYGVYKGDVGSDVQPVNSAGGLLIISIILTVLCTAMVGLGVWAVGQELGYFPRPAEYTHFDPVMGFFFLFTLMFPFWSWALYRKERRAQKLRMARGLPKDLS